MSYRRELLVEPGTKVRLDKIDPNDKGIHASHESTRAQIAENVTRMNSLQYLLYVAAFEEALEKTSREHAPWFVIPSSHKWFRNLAISSIVAETMEDMGRKLPPTRVDLEEIRAKYHAAERERGVQGSGG